MFAPHLAAEQALLVSAPVNWAEKMMESVTDTNDQILRQSLEQTMQRQSLELQIESDMLQSDDPTASKKQNHYKIEAKLSENEPGNDCLS